MKIVGIKETFNDYKKVSLLVAVRDCDYKCCKEANIPISTCHNHALDNNKELEVNNKELGDKIVSNSIIEAVIFAGKEPMLDKYFYDIVEVIKYMRCELKSNIDIILFTGYREDELIDKIDILKDYKNIIVKFGRFVPNMESVYDEVGGIYLANKGQYFKKIGGI